MRAFAAGLTGSAVALPVLCGLALPAWCADGPGAPAAGLRQPRGAAQADGLLLDFDIPAQPLAAALRQYASVTLQSTMFRSDIVAGLTSSAVRGRYPAEAALQRLLAGTGLAAEKVDTGPAGVFVLKLIGDAPVAAARGMPRASEVPRSLMGYPAEIQARVWQALCSDRRTEPGGYRMLLRFRVDAAGTLRQPYLLVSTGDARRDEVVLEVLRRVRMDAAPPPDMPQPVAMLIQPRAPGSAQHCGRAS
ncbi:hypothetical protein GCM10023144_21610 [Pigmentiphaga soli]|uniref:Secretin/TonB short N-terminal domain-containing protein n=1 Tax=Pigmentiphaga soli TaxID=1007095 RepID=A0ABP8GZ53_9BURK